MKQRKRLKFCRDHEHWTLEDWKNVIFSDETSVVIGQRRGAVRIWRTSDESTNPTCVRRRYKGYSDFMVWASFTYDRKGPLHIWNPETTQEKRQAERDIALLNEQLEPIKKAEWELNTSMSRLGLRGIRGPKPEWKWNKKNGKLERDARGGIDWYRYQKEVLVPKLIPFAKECMIQRPNTIVLEDGAPSHRHHYQQTIYSRHGVQRMMDWPGNSPDLNAIEPCWPWLKRRTTSRGAPGDTKTARQAWIKAWEDLPQENIQQWIERLMRHVKEVIQLEGGNEYKEGRTGKDNREWKGQRIKGQLSRRQDLVDL